MKKHSISISVILLIAQVILGQQTIPSNLKIYNLESKETKTIVNDTAFYIYFDPKTKDTEVQKYSLTEVFDNDSDNIKIVKIDTIITQKEVITKENKSLSEDIYRAGIIGLGSISTEAFTEANTAARLSIFAKPYIHSNIFLSYNKNATTGDSLSPGSILFPETGNSAFLLTYDIFNYGWVDKYNVNSQHFVTPFTEFSWQNTKKTINDSLYHFSALNMSLGGKYTWYLKGATSTEDPTKQNIALTVTPAITYLNILNKDYSDFVTLFGDDLETAEGEIGGESLTSVSSDLFYWGAKIEFSIAEFSIYAAFKSPFQSDERIPMRAFKGGNLMIGTTIQGAIMRFK